MTNEKFPEDKEYLDNNFPKGKTKFRGQAMVLLALSRNQGKSEARKEFLKEKAKWTEERGRMAKLLFEKGIRSW